MKTLATRALRALIDLTVLGAAYVVAHELRFNFETPAIEFRRIFIFLPYVVLLKYALLSIQQVHRQSWRYTTLGDMLAILRSLLAAATILALGRFLAPPLTERFAFIAYVGTPYSVVAIDLSLSLLGLGAVRAVRRLQVEYREQSAVFGDGSTGRRRVILIGAGRAGLGVARELHHRPDLGIEGVAFLDDDPRKQGQVIHGIRVVGTTRDLKRVSAELDVEEAIITIANATGATVRRLQEACADAGLKTRIIPGMYEIVGGRVNLSRIRPVAIEDLLGREPVELDVSAIRTYIAKNVVLVTGAGGSIGSELCRQLAAFEPDRLVLVEQSENALWQLQRDLEERFPPSSIIPAIADVCDRERMVQLIQHHRPQTIFHAAAHKHVPMMEWNPGEALKNNVLGTKIVADLALECGVDRFVMISTDKAVNPTSVMGATKRLAERYVQHLAQTSGRRFVSVRFGNVLGSTGSVIPVFKEQIARGGPITVTHPDMVRYFMTIPESAQLVLQAAALGKGGEIFVLDMGEPVRIVDLAHDLIRLSGFEPDTDISIEFTGMRPGEKMFEELHRSQESADRTRHPKIWVSHSPPEVTPLSELDDILRLCASSDSEAVRHFLKRLVPEYQASQLPPTAADTGAFLATAGRGIRPVPPREKDLPEHG